MTRYKIAQANNRIKRIQRQQCIKLDKIEWDMLDDEEKEIELAKIEKQKEYLYNEVNNLI